MTRGVWFGDSSWSDRILVWQGLIRVEAHYPPQEAERVAVDRELWQRRHQSATPLDLQLVEHGLG